MAIGDTVTEINSLQIGELYGWRLWWLNLDTCRLHSWVRRSTAWGQSYMYGIVPNKIVEYDTLSLEEQRVYTCCSHNGLINIGGVGVYSFKTKKLLRKSGYYTEGCFFSNYLNQIPVYGKVKMWGKVAVHEKGYRAEYAKPHSFRALRLSRNFIYRKELQKAREYYGCANE